MRSRIPFISNPFGAISPNKICYIVEIILLQAYSDRPLTDIAHKGGGGGLGWVDFSSPPFLKIIGSY